MRQALCAGSEANEVGKVRILEVLETRIHARKIYASEVFEKWPDLGLVSSKASMNVRIFPHGTIGTVSAIFLPLIMPNTCTRVSDCLTQKVCPPGCP